MKKKKKTNNENRKEKRRELKRKHRSKKAIMKYNVKKWFSLTAGHQREWNLNGEMLQIMSNARHIMKSLKLFCRHANNVTYMYIHPIEVCCFPYSCFSTEYTIHPDLITLKDGTYLFQTLKMVNCADLVSWSWTFQYFFFFKMIIVLFFHKHNDSENDPNIIENLYAIVMSIKKKCKYA